MHEEDLILPTNHIPTTNEFLEALHIKPAALGAQLFMPVYHQFFTWSVELRDQYERYYCVEYSSLRDYLELAHEIYLDPSDLEKKHILKIKSPWGVVDQAYDGNSLDVVLDCIRKLEETHEDKDGLRFE